MFLKYVTFTNSFSIVLEIICSPLHRVIIKITAI